LDGISFCAGATADFLVVSIMYPCLGY